MIQTRARLEALEDHVLAPYGIRSRDSRGRQYPEDEPAERTVFQRDRDRIVHTTAFRRLEYKTQVFVNYEGDYYRTRLTHTLEVTQIGRTLARALGANEDLVEAVCLAHDLGHPPFGHAGESALARLMADHDGFDHNRQSLRIVTLLEHRYPEFPGLNLTWEVREAIVKHETEYDVADAAGYDPEKRGSLEAQISNVADELAYTAHDLDDGLRSGLIVPRQLHGLELWDRLCQSLGWRPEDIDDLARHRLIRRLIGLEVTDLLGATSERIQKGGVDSVEGLQHLTYHVAGFSATMAGMNRQLKDFLYRNMYQHHRVVRMQVKADSFLEDLFNAYVRNPEILPEAVQARGGEEDFHRVVCDYIAGMTDRFALQEHSKLFDPATQP
ncbi:MAG: deoxyguanosinetriphosphate triphosphohydrolase [Gammaproteobacteria bacterium RBG_16_66_13]|nr:MAG: deoxyguanosinetriphosphate triphosphohydrolase [Gammaproteobacteria bacterium RBG_16_66_13]